MWGAGMSQETAHGATRSAKRDAREDFKFKRSRFVARFPRDYLYSPAHFWLSQETEQQWRIGLTTFATRMLGEIVELDFEVKPDHEITLGSVVGWVEGFKATADLFAVASGRFIEGNQQALDDAERICNDPYGEGWLYRIEGTPDPQTVDVHAYAELLGEKIDQMEERPWQAPEMG